MSACDECLADAKSSAEVFLLDLILSPETPQEGGAATLILPISTEKEARLKETRSFF